MRRRFARISPALLVGLISVASAARAQTVDQAAVSNMALGLKLCLQQAPSPQARAQWFRQAGFAEQVQRNGGDTTHFFTAPASTAVIVLSYGQLPEECVVSSTRMGVSGASQVLDWVVPKVYPGYLRKVEQGPVNPAMGRPAQCVRYEDPANEIGLAIAVFSGDPNRTDCIEDGTSRISSFYRV